VDVAITVMADHPIDLHNHRGIRRATKIGANPSHPAFVREQEQLERMLLDAPEATWPEAADLARILRRLISLNDPPDARRQRLIQSLMEEYRRLCSDAD
jgi:hypothetical protein